MEDKQRGGCRSWWVLVVLLAAAELVRSGVYACSPSESRALLNLKGNDTNNVLPSWKRGTDCCSDWAGIMCNSSTGHVIQVNLTSEPGVLISDSLSDEICNLHNLQLLSLGSLLEFNIGGIQVRESSMQGGEIPACLWNMTQLEYVDLNGQKLSGSFSPEVCNLGRLRLLDLAGNSVTGHLPPCIWNSTELQYLDLSSNARITGGVLPDASAWALKALHHLALSGLGIYGALPAWIGNLSTLEYLDVSSNMITTLPHSLASLPMLQYLDVSSNMITMLGPDSLGWNSSQLQHLDVSSNMISALLSFPTPLQYLSAADNRIRQISSSIGGLGSGVQVITLSNNLIRSIPASIGNLSGLQSFAFDGNWVAVVPPSIGNCLHLAYLDLHGNWIRELPDSLGQLSKLEYLSLSKNHLSGNLSWPSWNNLSRLSSFDVSHNKLRGKIPAQFSQLSQLSSLDLSNNNFTGQIPRSLVALTLLDTLNLDCNQLVGVVPPFNISLSPEFFLLNVSRNQLTGHVPEVTGGYAGSVLLDISFNNFTGPLPRLGLSIFGSLQLSNNGITGSIPDALANSSDLQILDLSLNQLSGPLPEFWGSMESLKVLNLASNGFTGPLPTSLGSCSQLQRLQAGNNSLTGKIPSSLGRIGGSLVSLSLHNNYFEGEIHPSLTNFTSLTVLDLSGNRLNGTMPSTFKSLPPSLRVFMVGSNQLSGPFPSWIVNLTSLQVLDLSNNAFWGELPRNYSKLQGFTSGSSRSNNETLYDDEIQISAKGGDLELTYILSVRTSFDVSNNQLTGSIPEQLCELLSLRYLTLARNRLSGSIPGSLSDLRELESLDLSRNHLTGSIPLELNKISTLSYLNVSSNQLTGPVPSGGQLATFSTASFADNLGLCGFPLPTCPSGLTPAQPPRTAWPHKYEIGTIGDWISLVGFLVGFVASFGTVSSLFALSKGARSYLWAPWKRPKKLVYDYGKPYGAYMPRQ